MERLRELPHAWTVVTLLAGVVVLDQALKWWAWRYTPTAVINRGGNPLVPSTVDHGYADPVIGALLDLMGVGLLAFAVSTLVFRRRSSMILVTGAVMLGGWTSNLLDRLGLHYWTAPGSIRGAVDFIHVGLIKFNVADVFIALGTPLFLLAAGASCLAGRATMGPAAASSPRARTTRRTWTRAIALAGGVGLVAVVGIGASNYGGVTAPSTSARSGQV